MAREPRRLGSVKEDQTFLQWMRAEMRDYYPWWLWLLPIVALYFVILWVVRSTQWHRAYGRRARNQETFAAILAVVVVGFLLVVGIWALIDWVVSW